MKPTREVIENAVREAIGVELQAWARGERCTWWYWARARWNDRTGMQITTGCDASPIYPEDEYFHRGEYPPVTFWEFKENYTPDPDCCRVEPVLDDEGPWIGLESEDGGVEEWKYVNGLILDGEDLEHLLEQGWERYSLEKRWDEGDENEVQEAIDEICRAWGVPDQPEDSDLADKQEQLYGNESVW